MIKDVFFKNKLKLISSSMMYNHNCIIIVSTKIGYYVILILHFCWDIHIFPVIYFQLVIYMKACVETKTIPHVQQQNQHQNYLNLYQELEEKLGKESSYHVLKKNCERVRYQYQEGRKIKPKMVIRLINWLESLCVKFSNHLSRKTLQLSLRILLKYLGSYDEVIQQLQITGCVVLHLASKMIQKNILHKEFYCEASKNIFTPEQFNLKEQHVLLTIQFDINFMTFYEVIDYLQTKLGISNEHVELLKKITEQLIKIQAVWELNQMSVILLLAIVLKVEGSFPSIDKLLQLLKLK